MKANRDWLTMSEAAEMLGVSRQRMHQIVSEENLETTSINPRLTLIDRKILDEIAKKRKLGNTA